MKFLFFLVFPSNQSVQSVQSVLDESKRDFNLGILNPVLPVNSNASDFFDDYEWDKIVNGMIWEREPKFS